MTDDTPFYAPDHKATPKPERPRELLGTMTRRARGPRE